MAQQIRIDSSEYQRILEIDGIRRIIYPIIFRDANIETRVGAWLGALNRDTQIGCSINVLHFLGVIDDETANTSLLDPEIVHPQEGTAIETIVAFFNHKFEEHGLNRICIKLTTNILTPQKLTELFNMFHHILEPDTCMIVRYGRAVAEAIMFRPLRVNGTPFSAGHYVIVAKHQNDTLITVDPLTSTRYVYNPATGVTDNFWRHWVASYIDISILCVYDPDVVGGSPRSIRNKGIITKSGAYIVPKNIMKQFDKALINSVSCSLSEKSNIAMPIKNTQRYKKQSNISRGGRRRRRQNKTHVKLKIGNGTKLNP
jgi:hypothetical protein